MTQPDDIGNLHYCIDDLVRSNKVKASKIDGLRSAVEEALVLIDNLAENVKNNEFGVEDLIGIALLLSSALEKDS